MMNEIQTAIKKRVKARPGKQDKKAWVNLWTVVGDNERAIKPLLLSDTLDTDELMQLFLAIEVLGLRPLYGDGRQAITQSVLDGKLDRPWMVKHE